MIKNIPMLEQLVDHCRYVYLWEKAHLLDFVLNEEAFGFEDTEDADVVGAHTGCLLQSILHEGYLGHSVNVYPID